MGKQGKKRCLLHILALVHILFTGDLLHHFYFAVNIVIKWAVKNGIKEAYSAITGKKTDEDIQNEKELKELGLDSEDQ